MATADLWPLSSQLRRRSWWSPFHTTRPTGHSSFSSSFPLIVRWWWPCRLFGKEASSAFAFPDGIGTTFANLQILNLCTHTHTQQEREKLTTPKVSNEGHPAHDKNTTRSTERRSRRLDRRRKSSWDAITSSPCPICKRTLSPARHHVRLFCHNRPNSRASTGALRMHVDGNGTVDDIFGHSQSYAAGVFITSPRFHIGRIFSRSSTKR